MSTVSQTPSKTASPSLFSVSRIHLVGVKGVAMTSLAQCLTDLGKTITGSDVAQDFVTKDILAALPLTIYTGFLPEHISDSVDMVIYTGAHQGRNNPEVLEAKAKNIPCMTHAQALGQLMDTKRGISVCGTGGKSTTSAMIAWILTYAQMSPSFSVGVGNIPSIGTTGQYAATSEFFVAEADEYAVDPTSDHRPRFIYQHPAVVVCPNLSYDHPDIYPDFETMKKTFASFFAQSESLYVNGDVPELLQLFHEIQKNDTHTSFSVGFGQQSDYKLAIVENSEGLVRFSIEYMGAAQYPLVHSKTAWEGTLKVPGKHNVLNASLAFITAVHTCGVAAEVAIEALSKFTGTMRRFEYKGTYDGMPMYDDYAHTPHEIEATLTALREWYPEKKIIAAFQPHTYSRTKALFDGFVSSLSLADQPIIIDIFASARESADPSISSKLLAEKIGQTYSQLAVSWCEDIDALLSKIIRMPKQDCVFITLGAGDIYTVYERLGQ